MKGKIKQQWGQLTDNDLAQINGRRDQLEGKIQQRYGLAKDRVRKDGRRFGWTLSPSDGYGIGRAKRLFIFLLRRRQFPCSVAPAMQQGGEGQWSRGKVRADNLCGGQEQDSGRRIDHSKSNLSWRGRCS